MSDDEILDGFPGEKPPGLDRLPYARRVAQMIRQPPVLERWQSMCHKAFDESRKRHEQYEHWHKKRTEFTLLSNQRRRVALPWEPPENWVRVPVWIGATEFAQALIPPEFARDEEPYIGPLPFSSRHTLSLADCYFVLALVHDSERRTGGINPFPGGLFFWEAQQQQARCLSTKDELTLDDCLARIEADLRGRQPSGVVGTAHAAESGQVLPAQGVVQLAEPGSPAQDSSARPLVDQQSAMTWQEAAKRLIRLRNQGEQWTSYETLGEQIGCSAATVHKAVDRTPELQAWARRQAAPRAQQGVEGRVIDNAAQARELNPEDEAAIREYIEQALPEVKAWFLALPLEKQLEVVNDPERHQKAFPKV